MRLDSIHGKVTPFFVVESGIKVSLTPKEHYQAEQIGSLRYEENIKKNITCQNNPPKDWRERRMKQGSVAERAVSKALGYPWKGKGVHGEPDVGDDIEVKCTKYPDGKLIVQKHTPDDLKCILVIGVKLNYTLVGWMMSQDAKQKKYLWKPNGEQGREAYFVPQSDLRPCSELELK